MLRMTSKLEDYAAMGIGQIWLLHPETGQFQQFSSGALTPATSLEIQGIVADLSGVTAFRQR